MARDELGSQSSDQDDDFGDDDNLENTYLTFAVGGERFALHVAHVTEIVRLQKIFSVPDVPSHIRGVINLRGKVIPLLDVRARFGIEQVDYNDRTVVVVIDIDDTPTGLIVDRVFDITEIAPGDVEPAPPTNQLERSPLITRISKRADLVTFIVDVATLVNAAPIAAAPAPAAAPALPPSPSSSRERPSA